MPDSKKDEIVTAECLENHVLKGVATLTCQSDGTWSSEVPACEEVGKFIVRGQNKITVTNISEILTIITHTHFIL